MVNPRSIFLVLVGALGLCAQSKLSIEQMALHQFEDGPVLPATYEFVPGETVYFSCRIAGFHIDKKEQDDQVVRQSVKLSWQMRATDPAGVLLEKEKAGLIEERLLPQDKNWVPKFLVSFVIPSVAPTDTYKIGVQIKDEFAAAQASGELRFRVHGHEVEPSDTLLARNFQFLRSENDQAPMRNPVYHAGETLFARFDLTGFKFGENNLFQVSYGLAVLNAASVQMFAQPEAASETNRSFYPQRFVGGMLSLNLDPNLAKGSYILVITADDKIGKQTWEAQHRFEVE
ncbi:MAG: hypothetical protein ABSB35_31350 [Bryobacteraceae bacterium]